jgi:hypothetical protein
VLYAKIRFIYSSILVDDVTFTITLLLGWRAKSVYVFDVVEGRRVRKMEGLPHRPFSVHLCCDDTILIAASRINYDAYW